METEVVMNIDLMNDGSLKVNMVNQKFDLRGLKITVIKERPPIEWGKLLKKLVERYPSSWFEKVNK